MAAEKTEGKMEKEEKAEIAVEEKAEAKYTEPVERKFRKRGVEEPREDRIAAWKPKTKLGLRVKNGEIKDIDAILDAGYKILEAGIPDYLVNLKTELVAIGQSKGKFGGGKKRVWRQTQRKTAEGNVATFACMAVVGDEAGHVGIGYGKAKETLPAKEKAIRNAKINVIKIARGCGGFACSCNNPHSIPFKVSGKCGSVKVILMPAPKGTGLVIEDECKKILALAGIKDIYSKTFGQTRTKVNMAKACFEALKKTKPARKK